MLFLLRLSLRESRRYLSPPSTRARCWGVRSWRCCTASVASRNLRSWTSSWRRRQESASNPTRQIASHIMYWTFSTTSNFSNWFTPRERHLSLSSCQSCLVGGARQVTSQRRRPFWQRSPSVERQVLSWERWQHISRAMLLLRYKIQTRFHLQDYYLLALIGKEMIYCLTTHSLSSFLTFLERSWIFLIAWSWKNRF